MPTYQYACTTSDCGNEFELVQSFTDPAASECPVCAGPVRKKFSAVGVVFKGSGFYRTDSRSSQHATDPAPGIASDGKGESGPAKGAGNGTGTTSKDGSAARKEPAGASSTGASAPAD